MLGGGNGIVGRKWVHCLTFLINLWTSFLLELGNTISSLFGGGTSSDAKENGTDAVQVRVEKHGE